MAMRPPSQQGMQMGSRAGPGSRAGSRAGSSYGAAMGANSLQTQIQVTKRPVKSQGMQGMQPGSAGPTRRVADRSYWIMLMRSKITELQAELERLRKEEEELQKQSQTVGGLGKKLKDGRAELAKYQKELADTNFALQKGQSGADMEAIINQTKALKAENQAEADTADDLFIKIEACERKIKEVEDEEESIKSQKFANAGQEERQLYAQVRKESEEVRGEVASRQKTLDALRRKLAGLNAELKADTLKQEALKLQDRKKKLEAKLNSMQEEIRNSDSGSLPDEKTKLTRKAAEGTERCEQLKGTIARMQEEVNQSTRNLKELETDLGQFKGGEAEKYKELEAKDREMSEFFSKFEAVKKEALAQSAKVEESIVSLLEKIGKTLQFQSNLPSIESVNQMSSQIDFKEKQMSNALTTQDRLRNELALRKKELEKVQNLDAKISSELEQITAKIKQQEEEITVFGNLEALRQEHEEKKKRLQEDRIRYMKAQQALKQNVTMLTAQQFEPLKQRLSDDNNHTTLMHQEQKIKLVQQTVFNLQDFIGQKQAESDYMPVKGRCLKTMDEINGITIQTINSNPKN